jgi:DNA-binding transcriptional ArsR family regulator
VSQGQSDAERRREQRLRLLEDHIGRAIAESEKSGELAAAPSFGKPLHFGDGYEETPPELRMAMKVLKDAGYVPPEVEVMREIAALQAELDALPAGDARAAGLRQRLIDKRQALALRLEKLRTSASL